MLLIRVIFIFKTDYFLYFIKYLVYEYVEVKLHTCMHNIHVYIFITQLMQRKINIKQKNIILTVSIHK